MSDAATPETSAQVRDGILRLFRRDLIGPTTPDDADLARECLAERPSRWYLAGFLAPSDDGSPSSIAAGDEAAAAEAEAAFDEAGLGDEAGGDAQADDDIGDAGAARRVFLPSSMGLTVLLPADTTLLDVQVTWGDYKPEPPLSEEAMAVGAEGDPPAVVWRRAPRESTLTLALPAEGAGVRTAEALLPESAAAGRPGGALQIRAHWRFMNVERVGGPPERLRVVTVFLVNRRPAARRAYVDVAYTFQTRLALRSPHGFRPLSTAADYGAEDWDARLADLHYRNVESYGFGRNASIAWRAEAGQVVEVSTDHLPTIDVPRTAPNTDIPGAEFGMLRLAASAAGGAGALTAALAGLPQDYAGWIAGQTAAAAALPGRRRDTAEELVAGMERACRRIRAGIELLARDAHARLAFEIMNRAIETAARRRDPNVETWTWRPFQLAFILLNLPGVVDGRDEDRETVDLLFFPTGGGKTEAYLGLAAFAIAHRRLTNGGVLGAGVAVIMRYTLRLLTLDQLQRAAGLICALELMRQGSDFRDGQGKRMLGDWPIEIGLWVGGTTSPNRLGGSGQKDPKARSAYQWLRWYRNGRKGAPSPIKECPWCKTPLEEQSYTFVPSQNLELRCRNHECDFTGDRPLPVIFVDDPIYRRLPTFIVATIDKFASLPWEGRVGNFFGRVDRHDASGFYGPADDPGLGDPLHQADRLEPPSLIIQDELHLISGPLGSVAGLYEAALDRLCSKTFTEHAVRPKVVASTATVRRAERQSEALFDRARTDIFPPPGVDRDDNYFSRTRAISTEDPGRRYVGLAAQGRGPRLVFLRALVSMAAAAGAAYARHGAGPNNPADPYMTALCYFNALRELGGARRIVEDEVRDKLANYGARRRLEPDDAPFGDRRIDAPVELTSREPTDRVSETRTRLAVPFNAGGSSDRVPIDVALATNMISVGLDITRLGLMVVQGQPKMSAEYIQATSRVGRDHNRPGIVLTLLNLHKPRDRMHYEAFGHYHRTFYRSVEATSVTPWSSRSLDRALAAVAVAIARHGEPALARNDAALTIADFDHIEDEVVASVLGRKRSDDAPGGKEALEEMTRRVFRAWREIAEEQSGASLKYEARPNDPSGLLQMPLASAFASTDPRRLFEASRSMRDVEFEAPISVRQPNGLRLKS